MISFFPTEIKDAKMPKSAKTKGILKEKNRLENLVRPST